MTSLLLLESCAVELPLSIVSAVLACGVLLIGLPHGGMDQKVGLKLLDRFPRKFATAIFLTVYLSVAGIVISGWFFEPRITILSFFTLAAWHFGLEEQNRPTRSPIARLSSIARGGMVIWIPAVFRGSDIVALLTAILPSNSINLAEQVVLAIQTISPILFILLAYDLCFLNSEKSERWLSKKGLSFDQVRIVAFGFLFAIANPLVSFGIYFCLWHSVIGLINLRIQFSLTKLELVKKISPISTAAILLFGVGFIVSRNANPLTPAILQSIFIGLSAVAVPHLILHVISDSKRLNSTGVSQ